MPTPTTSLTAKIRTAPKQPGCYLFKSERGNIIYVGKAKSLHSRVRQYFQGSRGIDDKIGRLVRSIRDVEYRVTASELDALLLEHRLIKQYKPWYNSQLKADRLHP